MVILTAVIVRFGKVCQSWKDELLFLAVVLTYPIATITAVKIIALKIISPSAFQIFQYILCAPKHTAGIFFFQNIPAGGFLPCRRKANHACGLAGFYVLNCVSYIT